MIHSNDDSYEIGNFIFYENGEIGKVMPVNEEVPKYKDNYHFDDFMDKIMDEITETNPSLVFIEGMTYMAEKMLDWFRTYHGWIER